MAKAVKSDAEMIVTLGRRGINLQIKIDALVAEQRKISVELYDLLERDRIDHPELQQKVYDIGATGHLQAEWTPSYPVSEARAVALKEEMGADLFYKFFTEKVSYSRTRQYGALLRNASAATPFAAKIQQAVRTVWPKRPKLTYKPASKD